MVPGYGVETNGATARSQTGDPIDLFREGPDQVFHCLPGRMDTVIYVFYGLLE